MSDIVACSGGGRGCLTTMYVRFWPQADGHNMKPKFNTFEKLG